MTLAKVYAFAQQLRWMFKFAFLHLLRSYSSLASFAAIDKLAMALNGLRQLSQVSYVGIKQGLNFKQNISKMKKYIQFYTSSGVFSPNLFKHISNVFWYMRQIEKCSVILIAWESTTKVTTLCKWTLGLGKRIVCLKGLSLKWLLFLGVNIWEAWSL